MTYTTSNGRVLRIISNSVTYNNSESNAERLDGIIDDPRYWEEELSESDIEAIYDSY